jgi:hypothetical protein
VPSGHDVVEHAHVPEQLDVLEGAGDAEPGHGAWRPARNVLAAEADATLAAVDAADAVEHAGLAGAVGADQREQLRRLDGEGHGLEHGEAAEAQAQALDVELSHTISGCGGIA